MCYTFTIMIYKTTHTLIAVERIEMSEIFEICHQMSYWIMANPRIWDIVFTSIPDKNIKN